MRKLAAVSRRRMLVFCLLLLVPVVSYGGYICYSTFPQGGDRCMRCDNFGSDGEYLGFIESCGPLVN